MPPGPMLPVQQQEKQLQAQQTALQSHVNGVAASAKALPILYSVTFPLDSTDQRKTPFEVIIENQRNVEKRHCEKNAHQVRIIN
mmetsp:Transcript_9252/g.10549  ORF Transcript_9252/g.10549 Transcript_9252/m.10549 type:complete len:84 (-) Transcript_9252:98-349(-)